MYSAGLWQGNTFQLRPLGAQQQQQHHHHHHIPHMWPKCHSQCTVPHYKTACNALPRPATLSVCWHHRNSQQQSARSCVAAAGRKQQPTGPSQQQRQQQPPSQQVSQQELAGPAEWDSEGEFDEGDEGEHEVLDEDEGEWDEDEYWEDEEEDEEDDDSSSVAPGVKQIPLDQTAVQFTQDDFVEVGLISRPHGVRGEVKVQLITDEPKKRLGTTGKRLWLQPLPLRSGLVPPSAAAARQTGGSDAFKLLRRVVVVSGRVARPGAKGQREEWAVKFEGINSREEAATLAGHKLLLALCDREARPHGRDEFFIDQLVGLKAVDAASGVLIGLVTEVYDNGASYSLLRVRLAPEEADIRASKYRSVLVPFVSEIVPTVDVAGGQLGMELPEGLLDTASSTKLRKAYTPEQQAQLREQLKRRQEQQREWRQKQQDT